jgi:hypothetical protein
VRLRPTFSEGGKLLRANRILEAEEAFVAEAAAQPRNPRPSLALGHIALTHDSLESAEAFLADAVARDSRCRDAHELLAQTYYRRSDFASAALNDGPSLLCFVDTGLAGGAFTCPGSTVKAAGIEFGKKPQGTGLGGGGRISFRLFDVGSLAMGGARRENLQGVLGPFPPALEHEYGVRIGGLVSHGYLCAYAVTFDFERMVLRLEAAGA